MPRDNPPLSVEEEARRAIDRSLSRGIRELAFHEDIPEPLDALYPSELYVKSYSSEESHATQD